MLRTYGTPNGLNDICYQHFAPMEHYFSFRRITPAETKNITLAAASLHIQLVVGISPHH